MPGPDPSTRDLRGLDLAGILRGALGDAADSWPPEGPVAWAPPDAEQIAALFPGFADITFINRGGMGAVYAARQITLDRRVALKLLPAELSRDPAAAERFRREARALACLSHPNIVGIHDFGETKDGTFFFVMEFVEGADLHRLIREGRLPLPDALDIVRQVCDALAFAHSRGFVHRDIKPANILVDARGRVKVSDFGLAKLLPDHAGAEEEPAGLLPTLTGSMAGTPEYSAPEQRRGDRPVDHRADIYSLGVMLYEMLTGRVPCGVFEPPSRRAGTGEALDRVVERAMQEEPDKRFQHAAEVKTEVEKAVAPGRHRFSPRLIGAVMLVSAGAVVLAMRTRSSPDGTPQPAAPPPAASQPDQVFTSSLGMPFLPTGIPGVLMAAGETRRRDFAAFIQATAEQPENSVMVPRGTTWVEIRGSWRNPPELPAQTPDHPVVAVDYDDAAAFCTWLTAKDRAAGLLPVDARYRLPVIDEWLTATGRKGPLESHLLSLTGPVIPLPGATGPAEVVVNPPNAVRELEWNAAEWTSTPGQEPGQWLVAGRSWAETPPYTGAPLPVRSYPRHLRGIALGFRAVLDRRPRP